MARLATIGVLLVALVVMAEASLVTVVERERCLQQLRGQSLNRQYLQKGDDGWLMSRRGGYQESLQDCCREPMNVEERCRCKAIEKAVEQAERGGYQGEQPRRMTRTRRALDLPSLCHMGEPQHCQIRSPYY